MSKRYSVCTKCGNKFLRRLKSINLLCMDCLSNKTSQSSTVSVFVDPYYYSLIMHQIDISRRNGVSVPVSSAVRLSSSSITDLYIQYAKSRGFTIVEDKKDEAK